MWTSAIVFSYLSVSVLGAAKPQQAQQATAFTCPTKDGIYCAGQSTRTQTIVSCKNGVATTGSCSDYLKGQFSTCYTTSPTAGDALCKSLGDLSFNAYEYAIAYEANGYGVYQYGSGFATLLNPNDPYCACAGQFANLPGFCKNPCATGRSTTSPRTPVGPSTTPSNSNGGISVTTVVNTIVTTICTSSTDAPMPTWTPYPIPQNSTWSAPPYTPPYTPPVVPSDNGTYTYNSPTLLTDSQPVPTMATPEPSMFTGAAVANAGSLARVLAVVAVGAAAGVF